MSWEPSKYPFQEPLWYRFIKWGMFVSIYAFFGFGLLVMVMTCSYATYDKLAPFFSEQIRLEREEAKLEHERHEREEAKLEYQREIERIDRAYDYYPHGGYLDQINEINHPKWDYYENQAWIEHDAIDGREEWPAW